MALGEKESRSVLGRHCLVLQTGQQKKRNKQTTERGRLGGLMKVCYNWKGRGRNIQEKQSQKKTHSYVEKTGKIKKRENTNLKTRRVKGNSGYSGI